MQYEEFFVAEAQRPLAGIGDDGTVQAIFPVGLTAPAAADATVSYATADGGSGLPAASAGVDYLAAAGTLLIPAGSSGGTLAVEVAGDLVDELDETFTVTLSDPTPASAVILDCEGIATIVDDDEALLSIGDVAIEEGDEGSMDAVFTVTLAVPGDREITVDYATAEDVALAGEDYVDTSGSLVFPPGTTERTLAVAVVGDVLLEPDEMFFVDLANPANTGIGDDRGVGTILDDEVCEGPNLLRNPGAERRPAGGDLSGEPPAGWSEVEGEEWQRRFVEPDPAEGEAYFAPGAVELAELAQDVDVSAYGARIAAGEQIFAFDGRVRTREEPSLDVARIVVEYRDAANAVVLEAFDSGEIASPFEWHSLSDVRAAPAGTGWIRVRLLSSRFSEGDNDGYFDALSLRSLRTATLSIDDVAVYEGSTGPGAPDRTDAVFTVSLACPYERELTVSFATADGGGGLAAALAVEDYLASAGTLALPAGETAAPIAVPVVGDEVHEPHEAFTVALSDPLADGESDLGQAVLLDAVGVGTIWNDDFCPRSPGFWKNHVADWPAEYLVLGGVEVGAQGMLDLLRYGGRDAASKLARQLVAAKLNLRVGSDPAILPVVGDADAFLAVFPPGSDPRGGDRGTANALKDELDAYNNRDCVEVPVDPTLR